MLNVPTKRLLPIIILLVGLCLGQQDDEESGKFNCFRPGMDCDNMDMGVTCPQGQCVCVEGLEGYDCSINSTYVIDVENCDGGCGTDGVCYQTVDENPVCKCSEDYTGVNCEDKRVSHKCLSDSVEISIAPLSEDGFIGLMHVLDYEDDVNCRLTPTEVGFYGNTFTFEDCGGAENETLPNGDNTLSFTIKVQHNVNLIQDTDESYRFVCKVKTSGSDVEWQGEGLDNEEDDENAHKEVEEDFNPVVQELLTQDGEEVMGRQKLGTPLTLQFRLQGGNVYDSFRVEEVEAWNGKEGPAAKTYPLVNDGCVTTDAAKGSKVVLDFTRTEEGTVVQLKYKLFRLPGSYELRFKNTVKACKSSQECNPIDCDMPFDQGFGRKRRSADYDMTLYERVNQTVFILHPDEVQRHKYNNYYIAKQELTDDDDDDDKRDTLVECMSSVGFLVICIVLAILLLLALAILAVFCVRMLHRHDGPRDTDGGKTNKGYAA